MLLTSSFNPVPGNDEKNHRAYYKYLAYPPDGGKDRRWWSLHWGDIVVVGMDSNVCSIADIKAQQSFLREELSGKEPHKLVIFYPPGVLLRCLPRKRLL